MTFAECLSLLQVILSGPSVLLIIFVIAFCLFKKDLRSLMGRIATLRFPGGEITTSQALRREETATAEVGHPPTNVAPPVLPGNLNLTPEVQTRIEELLRAERARAALWEYRYLNFFLVPRTQQVLDWLVSLPQRTTIQMADAFWAPTIPSVQERSAILTALESHHLVQVEGELLTVTPKGREYQQWRGPRTPVAAPATA